MSRKGNVWTILGGMLLLLAACLTIYNLWSDYMAGEWADGTLDSLIVIEESVPDTNKEDEIPDYILNPEMDMPEKTIDGYTYIGYLQIPTLNIELPVMTDWNYENLRKSPCRYSGSAYKDNLIICAHNYTTHFGGIKELAQGDQVVFTDVDGNVFLYHVEEMEVLMPTDVEGMKTEGWDLTLFTCTFGGQSRVTVRCSLTT